jgi:hypothetical protein
MENVMKGILVVAFGAGTLLDFLIVVLGMSIILHADSFFIYAICSVAGFALVSLKLCMNAIFSRDTFLYYCLRGAFVIAVVLSFVASINALVIHILLKKVEVSSPTFEWGEILSFGSFQLKFVLFAIAVYLTTSPIIMSHLACEYHKTAEEDDDDD